MGRTLAVLAALGPLACRSLDDAVYDSADDLCTRPLAAWCADAACDPLATDLATVRGQTCTEPAIWLVWRCQDEGTAWSLFESDDANGDVSQTRYYDRTGRLRGVERTGEAACGDEVASVTRWGAVGGCAVAWCLYETCTGDGAWPGTSPTCASGAEPPG